MFKESIRVIAVDDGSTDLSAEIIKRWQDRWPGAITYLKKENGGQASARNLGMNHTESEWVTFIDPDDFVSKRYFEEVDRAIVAWPSVQMVSCRLVYFFEKGRRYSLTPTRLTTITSMATNSIRRLTSTFLCSFQ